MKRTALILITLGVLLAACSREQSGAERQFPLRGKILGRDVAQNALTIQHQEVKGYMAAMTMTFPVKGAKVDELPAVGSEITATLHVTDRDYWVSDVKQVP